MITSATPSLPIQLWCDHCGRCFPFPEAEREALRAQRLPSPRLCPACRLEDERRELAEPVAAVCADCGRQFTLNVRLRRGHRRVYCEQCFKRRVAGRYGGGRVGDRTGG